MVGDVLPAGEVGHLLRQVDLELVPGGAPRVDGLQGGAAGVVEEQAQTGQVGPAAGGGQRGLQAVQLAQGQQPQTGVAVCVGAGRHGGRREGAFVDSYREGLVQEWLLGELDMGAAGVAAGRTGGGRNGLRHDLDDVRQLVLGLDSREVLLVLHAPRPLEHAELALRPLVHGHHGLLEPLRQVLHVLRTQHHPARPTTTPTRNPPRTASVGGSRVRGEALHGRRRQSPQLRGGLGFAEKRKHRTALTPTLTATALRHQPRHRQQPVLHEERQVFVPLDQRQQAHGGGPQTERFRVQDVLSRAVLGRQVRRGDECVEHHGAPQALGEGEGGAEVEARHEVEEERVGGPELHQHGAQVERRVGGGPRVGCGGEQHGCGQAAQRQQAQEQDALEEHAVHPGLLDGHHQHPLHGERVGLRGAQPHRRGVGPRPQRFVVVDVTHEVAHGGLQRPQQAAAGPVRRSRVGSFQLTPLAEVTAAGLAVTDHVVVVFGEVPRRPVDVGGRQDVPLARPVLAVVIVNRHRHQRRGRVVKQAHGGEVHEQGAGEGRARPTEGEVEPAVEGGQEGILRGRGRGRGRGGPPPVHEEVCDGAAPRRGPCSALLLGGAGEETTEGVSHHATTTRGPEPPLTTAARSCARRRLRTRIARVDLPQHVCDRLVCTARAAATRIHTVSAGSSATTAPSCALRPEPIQTHAHHQIDRQVRAVDGAGVRQRVLWSVAASSFQLELPA